MNLSFRTLLLGITLPLFLLDQISKWWIVLTFPEPGYGVRDIELTSWFHIIRVHNQGVAFGMGNGTTWAPLVFFFVPLLALTGIRYCWKKGVFHSKASRVAVSLLLAGIFGNFTDRLFQGFQLAEYAGESFWKRLSEGYVVDFIQWHHSGWYFPAFNLADSAITLGAICVILDEVLPSSQGWWPTFNVADSCICIAAGLLFFSGLTEEKKVSFAGK